MIDVTSAFHLNAIAQTSASQIVDCLVEGMLIAIFTAFLLRVTGRQTSGTRFAVWFSALTAIAVLPLFGGIWCSQVKGIASGPLSHGAITLPVSWALYLFGLWAAVAAWYLIGIGRGLRHLHVLRRSCRPVDPAVLSPRLRVLLASQGTRNVEVCTSDQVHIPTAIGLVRPAIVLPGWVLQELSADELNQILLHELAHMRRWDDWTNLAQKFVKALLFFHPAVWWIEKRVCLEREMACDDAVIAETASPRTYAECLAHLAEKTLVLRSMALAQAALGRVRQTSLRVAQILDANRPAGTSSGWKSAVSLVSGFALVCVLGISRSPSLVAFRDDAPSSVTNSTVAADFSDSGDAHVSPAAFQGQPVRVVPAMVKAEGTHPRADRYGRATVVQAKSAKQSAGPVVLQTAVHRTNVRRTDVGLTNADVVPVAFTETLFVVVEGREEGSAEQPVYQIQLWRVTVFRSAINRSSNRIPAKQT